MNNGVFLSFSEGMQGERLGSCLSMELGKLNRPREFLTLVLDPPVLAVD